jgi:hypothetical protein
MTDAERQLLQKLASAGKATTLSLSELLVAVLLEAQGLALIVPKTSDAIITPKRQKQACDHGAGDQTVEETNQLFRITPCAISTR